MIMLPPYGPLLGTLGKTFWSGPSAWSYPALTFIDSEGTAQST